MRGRLLAMPLSRTLVVMVLEMSDDRITPTPTMHAHHEPITLDELGQRISDGFANVLGELNEVNTRVGRVEDRIVILEAEVFTDPPPPPGAPLRARIPRRRTASLASRTGAAEGDLAELSGQIIAARAEAQEAREEAKAAREEAKAAREEAATAVSINKQQSRAMGLAMPDASLWRKTIALLWSRKGVELVIAVATLASVALGYERAGDALRKMQDTVQHMPAEAAPR